MQTLKQYQVCTKTRSIGVYLSRPYDYLSLRGALVIPALLKDQIKSLRWTVEVQRLLQPTRELVRSGYETGLGVKELLLPGD